MKTDKLLQLIQQKNPKRSGGALPLPKAQDGTIGGLWDTDRKAFVDSTLQANTDKEWVRRLYNNNAGSIQIPGEKYRSTHLMSNAGTRVYPEIQNINGKLTYLPEDQGWDYADQTKSYINFNYPQQADWFASNGYKTGTNVLNNINQKGVPINNPNYRLPKHQPGGRTTIYTTDNTPDSYFSPLENNIYLRPQNAHIPSVLPHELYHYNQWLNGDFSVDPSTYFNNLRKQKQLPENFHEGEFSDNLNYNIPLRKPSIAEREENQNNLTYYNRRPVEQEALTNNFLFHNPSFNLVNPGLVYDKKINPAMYETPWTLEGEAQQVGDRYIGPYKKGGSLPRAKVGGSLDKYQWKYGQVSPRDSVQNMAYNTMTYEANRGSGSGHGLSNFGNDALPTGATIDDAVNWYMQNIYPQLGDYPTAMEKAQAGDFLYNSGMNLLNYTDWDNRKDDVKAKQSWENKKKTLSVNDRRIALNNARDKFYQNRAPKGSTWDLKTQGPHPYYWDTWYGRQHATDQYVPLTAADVTDKTNTNFYPIKKEEGGSLPKAQLGKYIPSWLNPMNWGVPNYTKSGSFEDAFRDARGNKEDEFMWNDNRYTTETKEDVADQKVKDDDQLRINQKNDYYNWLKYQENGIKKGWDSKLKIWMPHKSPEEGLPTIGYGHKLTPEDVKSKRFEKGLTDQQAIELMQNDFTSHFNQAIIGYNNRFKNRNLKFDQLPYKQQLLIGDYVYNIGPDFFKEEGEHNPKAFPKFLNAIVDYNQAKSDKDKAKYRNIIAKQYSRKTGNSPNLTRNKGTVDFFLKDFGITPDMVDKSTYMAQGGQLLPMAQTGIPSDKLAQTPMKYDQPLKLADIKPVYHKNMVIDNYSPRANYLIQGDKLYMADKGKDTWFDISDNTFAKKNLYNFLSDKYDMIGYSNEEKDISGLLRANQYDYQQRYNPAPKPEEPKLQFSSTPAAPMLPKLIDPSKPYTKGNSSPLVVKEKPSLLQNIQDELTSTIGGVEDELASLYGSAKNTYDEISDKVDYYKNLGVNGITRRYRMYTGEDPDAVKIDFNEKQTPKPLGTTDYYNKYNKNKIQLKEVDIPDVTAKTGQTLLGGNMDLDNVKFKVRNRGDYNTFKSDGMLITAFRPFLAPDQYKAASDNSTYFGVDANGKFVAGTFKDFKNRKDVLISQTFMNKVVSFDEKDGKSITKEDKDHGNNNYQVPVVTALSDDEKTTKKGSLNIMVRTNGDEDYFGSVEGGKFVMQNPDTKKTYFVMGSLKHVKDQFKKIKGNSKYVNVYATDNGTYSKGLSFKDKTFTPERLKEYDALNKGGVAGNALYITGSSITPSKYKTEYFQTPNIRTEKDDSYKKGHPLKNEMKKIVLHWTAFEPSAQGDANLHNQYMTRGETTNNDSHLVVLADGTKRVYASPEQVTFHAGFSRLGDRDNVNDFSYGIEFQNQGNIFKDPKTGQMYAKPLSNQQVESAVESISELMDTYNLGLKDIVTHKMIRDNYINYYKGKKDKDGKLILNPGNSASKPDLDDYQYKQVIDALKARGYK